MSADEFHHRLDDVESRAHRRIDDLQRQVERVGNNAAPTIPTYDSKNWPQDAVYGQIIKDVQHRAWVYGEDDKWHPVGADSIISPPVQAVQLFDYPLLRYNQGSFSNLWYDTTWSGPTKGYLNNWHDNAFINARAGQNTVYSSSQINIGLKTLHTDAAADQIAGRFLVGPQYATLSLGTGFCWGSDFGRMKLQLAQVSEDYLGATGRLTPYDNLNWIDWLDTPTPVGTNANGFALDMYGDPTVYGVPSTTVMADYDPLTFWFRVMGERGDTFTKFTQGLTGPEIDGGPGIYAWRYVVWDKLSSSTNYKAGLWAMNWVRTEGTSGRSNFPS